MKFADYASEVLTTLHHHQYDDTADLQLFHGLPRDDFTNFLENYCLDFNESTISDSTFFAMVKAIPKISLTDEDAKKLLQALPSNIRIVSYPDAKSAVEGNKIQIRVNWSEFLGVAFDSIRAILKKKRASTVQSPSHHRRRGGLYNGVVIRPPAFEDENDQAEAKSQKVNEAAEVNNSVDVDYRTLADQLMSVINIKALNKKIVVVLPTDASNRRSSMLVASLRNTGNAPLQDKNVAEISKSIAVLPMLSSAFVASQGANVASASFYHQVKTQYANIPKMGVLLRLLAVDNTSMMSSSLGEDEELETESRQRNRFESQKVENLTTSVNEKEGKEIIANIISIDATFAQSISLPIRLPAIAQVDKELADEFSKNLVDKLFIEFVNEESIGNPSTLTLNMLP